ncbi:MAG: hypothetical protein JW944_01615 [Deltaproteobacteria bacterium]|nr:hypothetical protein [Deltaproteobacteria bacterium]
MEAKMFCKSLRYIFLAFVIALGFFVVIATGGGGGSEDEDNSNDEDTCDYDVDIVCDSNEDCYKMCFIHSGDPDDFIMFNDRLFFTAYEGCKDIAQLKLYEIDQSGNIVEISDLGSSITDKLILNDVLYFVQGGYLWKYDGVTPPQSLFPEDSEEYSGVEYLMEYNNRLYFSVYSNSVGDEVLFSYDISSDAPAIAGNVIPFFDDYNYIVYNNKLYFRGYTVESGTELWCYDDSSDSQYMVADINPSGSAFSYTSSIFVVFQGKLFFSADDSENGQQLWVIDGDNPPEKITDFSAEEYIRVNPVDVFNDKLLIEVMEKTNDITQCSLYEYDGNNPVSSLNFDQPYSSMIQYTNLFSNTYTILNNRFYFIACDITTGWDGSETLGATNLWVYDGVNTPEKIEYDYDTWFNISDLFIHDEELILKMSVDNIWAYDGISDPEQLVSPSQSGLDDIFLIMGFNDDYYITGETEEYGSELWKLDGSGEITLVNDFYPGTTCQCECD